MHFPPQPHAVAAAATKFMDSGRFRDRRTLPLPNPPPPVVAAQPHHWSRPPHASISPPPHPPKTTDSTAVAAPRRRHPPKHVKSKSGFKGVRLRDSGCSGVEFSATASGTGSTHSRQWRSSLGGLTVAFGAQLPRDRNPEGCVVHRAIGEHCVLLRAKRKTRIVLEERDT